MKDRFTVVLVAAVAFVGGLFAMVFVASWQAGAPNPPATRSDVVAQVVPEAAQGTTAFKRTTAAGVQTAVEPEPGERQEPIAPETGSSREVERSATTGAGRASAPSERAVGRDTVVGERVNPAGRPEPLGRGGTPNTQPPRDDRSSSSSGSGGAAAGGSGSSGGTKSSAGALPPDREFLISTPQETGRSMGRQPAAAALPGGTPADTTGANDNAPFIPDNTPEPDPYEPPDPLDDPQDEPEVDPEVDPEPEIPPALVKADTGSSTYNLNDVVPVQVVIQSGTDVGHVPFHLAYDPGVLRFERGEEGQFLNMDGSPTVFFAVPAGSGDEVLVGLSRLGHGPGIDGSGLLCVLHFVPVAPGTTQLRFKQADVKNSENVGMSALFNAGAVTVVANP